MEALLLGVLEEVYIIAPARAVVALREERAATTAEEEVDHGTQRVAVTNLVIRDGVERPAGGRVSGVDWASLAFPRRYSDWAQLTGRGRVVDGRGNHEAGPHASKLGGLEDGADRGAIREDGDGIVVRLEASSESGAGSSRIRDHVVSGPGANKAVGLQNSISACRPRVSEAVLMSLGAYQLISGQGLDAGVPAGGASLDERNQVTGHGLRGLTVAIGNDVDDVLGLDRGSLRGGEGGLGESRNGGDGSSSTHVERTRDDQ